MQTFLRFCETGLSVSCAQHRVHLQHVYSDPMESKYEAPSILVNPEVLVARSTNRSLKGLMLSLLLRSIFLQVASRCASSAKIHVSVSIIQRITNVRGLVK